MSDASPDGDRALESDETVRRTVRGLGATLVVTDRRVVIIREGAHTRPRGGVRGLALADLRAVYLVRSSRGGGQIVLRTGRHAWHAVSVFVANEDWADAQLVVAELRAGAARATRFGRERRPSDQP